MRISDRCYAITGLAYSSPWCVNAGFIAGHETTLIVDTGGNSYAGHTIHGYATAVRPSNGIQVVNTEKHFDHIGGNCVFNKLGIEIYGHPAIQRTAKEFRDELAEFNDAIPNPARRSAHEADAFFHGTELVNPKHAVHDGMQFDLGGGCVAHVHFTPGHTATNISIWIPSERVLYCGDCLISQYIPNLDAGSPRDWRIWLDSLDVVAALKPEIVVAGHGPVVQGAAAVAQMIDGVRRVLTQSIARGHSPTTASESNPTCD